MSAILEIDSISTFQEPWAGPSPGALLYNLKVLPIPFVTAKQLMVAEHYLHSFAGGTTLCLGVYLNNSLMGALTLGAGPFQGYALVKGAVRGNCVTLTRMWLSDQLPPNSESRVLGMVLRALQRNTHLKFVLAYSDPTEGHLGTIYQASNWLYTGLSSATHLYDIGDGVARHSRSVGQILGSHSIKYLTNQGSCVKLIPQAAKHRYMYFLDPQWRSRLLVPILAYPKRRNENGTVHDSYTLGPTGSSSLES